MKFILNYFSSVKLAITLLIIITLASILGTLIPQGRAEAEYAARYGQLAPLLIRLEVTDLYHSLLYRGLLYLFALNTAVCTLTRFGAKFRKAFRPRVEGEASKIRTLKSSGAFKLKGSLEQAAQKVESALKSRHFRTRQTVHEGRVSILAQKRIAGLFGSDIVHVGLLIILAGGIISGGDAGMRRMLTIHEGRTLEVPEAGISLRLDKFQTDYYPSGAVKDWKSTLTVIEGGEEIRTQTIEVNHPLSFRGFMFYQSSYGYDWENPRFEILAQKKDDPDFGDQLNLGLGEKTFLSDGQTEVEVINFVPDFIIGEDGRVASRSNQPNNPAVLIEGRQQGERLFAAWVFSKFPDFGQMHSEKEHEFSFQFQNIESTEYSGIEMAQDPGVNFIWAGCILLTLGLFVAFFWPPAEIRAVLEREKDRIQATAGGIATKNKDAFQTEFDAIVEDLRRDK
jgi:cytochrome c biogenesis protein